MSRLRAAPLICVALLVSGGAGERAAAASSSEPGAPAIGVAPFERAAEPGEEVPDVASRLAERLLAQGAGRVVGPQTLAAPAVAEPAPDEVRSWAEGSGVDAVVVGRSTRLGSRVSVEARLRSGASGAVLDTYVAELDAGPGRDAALDRLASEILAGAREAAGGPDMASAPAAEGASGGRTPDVPLGIPSGPAEGPIRISAGESEFRLDENRTIFKQDVRVTQGDITLTTERLESFFKQGSREPEKLVATGDVRVTQGDRSVRCDRAVFRNDAQQIVCRGHARATVGSSTASGEEIEFRLDQNRIFVRGGAELQIEPEEESEAAGGGGPPGGG